jgi:branched-chain amino acid transport system permease protein
MVRRLIMFVALAAVLFGCAPDEQQIAACRLIAETLTDPPLVDFRATTEAHALVLRFRADTTGAPHVLACRFVGGFGRDRFVLIAASLDGEPVPESSLILLRRAAGLPSPTQPTEPTPPIPGTDLAYLLQQVVNGLTIGAMLALVAIGYTLVYGISGTIQFAYGELFMIGAVTMTVVFGVLQALGLARPALALPLSVILTGAATTLYGWTAERLAHRPIWRTDRLAVLIAAIGLAIALREYVRLAQGARDKWLPPLFTTRHLVFEQAGFTVLVGDIQLVVLALAGFLGGGLALAMARTRWGRVYRACAEDATMAALLGVAVDRVVSLAFTLGATLAALAGVMIVAYYGEADFAMGYLFGFKALTAALLGGFGSLVGACLGGVLIGLLEALWSAYADLAYKDVAVFAVLVLILVFRPQGLFGFDPGMSPHDGRLRA